MRNRVGRIVFGVMSLVLLAVLPTGAAERICSVFLQSPAVLQQQAQDAALLFDSPGLGMLPMMTMMMPGGSQVKASEPVSLHVFDIGDGKTASVLELTPATTAEMFLKSLTAASGKPLAPAVEGRYMFDNGVAQVRGTRLLLAKTAAELDACTGGAVPALPPMPAIPGMIRIAMAPSAVVPMLEATKAQIVGAMAADGPQAAQAQEMIGMVFGLYTRALAQINTLNLGIGVQPEGLMIRSQLVPASGSTVAGILDSMQPVDPACLAFVRKDVIFSMASGAYTIPDQLQRQIVALYVKMIQASPMVADADDDELAFAMRESMASLGAAMALSMDMTNGGDNLLMQGAIGVQPAVPYLERMVALYKLPAMQAMTGQSGVSMELADKRMYKDYPVYGWNMSFDEAALRQQMGAAGQQMDASAFAPVNKMMQLFGKGYAYAATPKGLAFGLGSPTMVEQAADRLMAERADLAESKRIRTLLSPAVEPVVIGRLDLLGLMRAGAQMATSVAGTPVPAAVSSLPDGEGIVFADWIKGSEVNTALLVPTADIKALSAMATRLQAAEKTDE